MNDSKNIRSKDRLTLLTVLTILAGAALSAGSLAAQAACGGTLVPGCGEARAVPSAPGEPCNMTPTSADPLVLAAFQNWHGLCTHTSAFMPWDPPRAYDSSDRGVIAAQIAAAQAQCIDGFVVNWYGEPVAGLGNEMDREFMDAATAALFQAAADAGFCLALLYDEGTLPISKCEPLPTCGTKDCEPQPPYQDRARTDLLYAEQSYFDSPAYLKLDGKPALFVFPYPEVDPHLDWAMLRTALSQDVTLIDQNPDPDAPDPDHDEDFDGFYAWVQPNDWQVWPPDGQDWGDEYLHWFYRTMKDPALPYANKIAVGGVWPGFDDSLAPWGEDRFMSRGGRYVYDATWDIASCHQAEIVMIATWNDFEEGTDVEFGTGMCVDVGDLRADVLMRGAPIEVTWEGEGVLQLYEDGLLIYDQGHQPPVTIPSAAIPVPLESGHAYEVKVWIDGAPHAQRLKIRRQDPGSGPLFSDGFSSGNLCRWSAVTGAAPVTANP